MKREEQLEQLIEIRQHGAEPPVEASAELLARLAVAEVLTQYQELDVPQAMAERIERRVRTHIQQQGQCFAPTPVRTLAHPATRSPRPRRLVRLLLSAAVVLFLLCAGTLAAAVHALPGDPLYGIKQAESHWALTLAMSPSARAEECIGQLRSALDDLEAVVTDGRSPEVIQQALNTVITQTQNAQVTVATIAVASASGRVQVQQDLASVLGAENHMVRALLNHVNWSLRLAFTQQLGTIGQAVPVIQQVSVRQSNDGTLLVTVTGRHFAPQAHLVINGQPRGIFSAQGATQLVGTMSQDDWQNKTQMIGVLNPDGTATQTTVVFHPTDDHQQGGEGQHGGHGGPGKSTPTSGGDRGNHDGPSGSSSTPTSGDDHRGSGKKDSGRN